MKTTDCHTIDELLVAFDDGELPAADVARVEAHLRRCGECRRELSALRRSLDAARLQWQQQTPDKPDTISGTESPGPQRLSAPATMVVAATLLVAVTVGVWWLLRGGDELVAVHRAPVHEHQVERAAPLPADSIDAIKQMLDDEAIAARLAASAAVLSEQAGAEGYGRSAYHYLARTFPHTAAGREAATLLSQKSEIMP